MDKYTDDIAKYHKGTLTSAERHALEKKALSDPFLADALEGAGQISPDDLARDVADLQRKIKGGGQRPLFTPLRIAAGVVVIVAAGWMTLYLVRTSDPALLSENQLKQELIEAAKDSSAQAAGEEKQQAQAEKDEQKEEPKSDRLLSLNQAKKEKKADDKSTAGPTEKETKPAEIVFEESIVAADVVEEAREDVRDSVAAPSVATPAPVTQPPLQALSAGEAQRRTAEETQDRRARAAKMKSTLSDDFASTTITGKVTLAEDGLALPGVNVRVKGSSKGTVTDLKGNYIVDAGAAKPTLVFSFIGLQTKEVSSAGDTLDVALAEDISQLSEVVVTGKKTPVDLDGDPIVKLAEPVGGYRAYDKYLDGGLRYPQQAIENNVKGRVTIQFTVGIDGSLDEFTVMKSLGFGCDEEVIRLVQEGPPWNPTTENSVPTESIVRVRMKFDAAKAKK